MCHTVQSLPLYRQGNGTQRCNDFFKVTPEAAEWGENTQGLTLKPVLSLLHQTAWDLACPHRVRSVGFA